MSTAEQRQQCCGNTVLQNMHYGPQFDSNLCLYCTDRQTVNTTKMTNEHAQYFLVNNQLLLPNLKAFAQFTLSQHATRNALCFQSVSSSRTVCRCPNRCLPQSTPPHNIRHAHPTYWIICRSEKVLLWMESSYLIEHLNEEWKLNSTYSQYLH